MDPQLVDKIVHEVKSQGVFDEFRKDSMADVDTKPAYQNLRQRVENTVKKFLSEQKWSPEINKNQLRERLRKHITDSGFLDVGVERIVDQVVNPKVGTVFQPKIEDIAYKYLGVPKPLKLEPIPILHQMPPFPPVNGSSLKIETLHLLPTDLEQVSPDSDKATVTSETKDECIGMDLEEKIDDDDESPPFEPLEQEEYAIKKEEVSNSDLTALKIKALENDEKLEEPENPINVAVKTELDSETQDTSSVSIKTEEQESDKDVNHVPDGFQESQSQLSQVSSDSRLSVGMHDNNNGCSDDFNSKSHDNAVNISEEAQMPKFSENSSDENVDNGNKDELHFDIKQDEIKFEGTKRKTSLQNTEDLPITPNCNVEPKLADEHLNMTEISLFQEKDKVSAEEHSFKFTKINVQPKDEIPINETSFSSSLEDSGTAHLCIVDKSENTQISEPDYKPSIVETNVDDTPYKTNQALPMTAAIFNASSEDKTSLREEVTRNESPSTSSRHKKHSKQKKTEKDRCRDKEREKEKEKDREKLREKEKLRHIKGKSSPSAPSVSRHSSSTSSKHNHNHSSSKPSSSSANKFVDANNKETSSKSKHSSSSSRSKSRDESKQGGRDYDKKPHSSSSKERSSTITQKKGERKSTNQPHDDHYASKDKIHWRKSTDSNDEDKKPDSVNGKTCSKLTDSAKNATSECSSNNKYKNGNNTKTITTASSLSNAAKCLDENKLNTLEESANSTNNNNINNNNNSVETGRSKIVILNEILENPTTEFIDLGSASQDTYRMHIVCSEDRVGVDQMETMPLCINENELCFFEQNVGQFVDRLKILDTAIDGCRQTVNSLRFDSDSTLIEEELSKNYIENINSTASSHLIPTGSKRELNESGTRATLHIDCIQYKGTPQVDFEEDINKKRFKYVSSIAATMVSPTPSETSANSKENEFMAADITAEPKKSVSLTAKRNSSLSKLSHQRYTSEDLYKPRPVLGQRSRRRGFYDSIV